MQSSFGVKKPLWWAAFGLIAAAAGAIFLTGEPEYEPDRKSYPLRGVDVSHHQGKIEWTAVAKDRVTFAFLKATEGGDYRDTRFLSNWVEARAAGLKVGAYHFFTLCRAGADQASNFIAVVPGDKNTLPPVLDLEFPGNCPRRPESDQLKQEVDSFLSLVEEHFKRPALLYVGDDFEAMYAAALPQRKRWVRSTSATPPTDAWAFWQYSDAGKIAGIPNAVDLNVFHGDEAALFDLVRPASVKQ